MAIIILSGFPLRGPKDILIVANEFNKRYIAGDDLGETVGVADGKTIGLGEIDGSELGAGEGVSTSTIGKRLACGFATVEVFLPKINAPIAIRTINANTIMTVDNQRIIR
jgi:hypothetical protein